MRRPEPRGRTAVETAGGGVDTGLQRIVATTYDVPVEHPEETVPALGDN